MRNALVLLYTIVKVFLKGEGPREVLLKKKGACIRVLVAFEDHYRAYREVIAAGIAVLRPSTEVATTRPQELAHEMARFDPQLVVCTQSAEATRSPPTPPAWVKVPTDPTQPTEVLVGERRWTSSALTLEALLAVIDEVEGAKPPAAKTTTP